MLFIYVMQRGIDFFLVGSKNLFPFLCENVISPFYFMWRRVRGWRGCFEECAAVVTAKIWKEVFLLIHFESIQRIIDFFTIVMLGVGKDKLVLPLKPLRFRSR